MNNLYMLVKIHCLQYRMSHKVVMYDITRPPLRDIPPNIKQEEVTKKRELKKVYHTMEAAILKGAIFANN